MKTYGVMTICETHGERIMEAIVGEGQTIEEVAGCPPVCPECEPIGPQAEWMSVYVEMGSTRKRAKR